MPQGNSQNYGIEPDIAIIPDIYIPANDVALLGDLIMPVDPLGLVIFIHGSGSSRKSPRNQHVAQRLNDEGLATLLVDLLTPDETAIDDATKELRFDIPMLAERVIGITRFMSEYPKTEFLNMGYFGASTGAAAALEAAADIWDKIKAVVSRGGRVDLSVKLPHVKIPTLLLVGSLDTEVLELNRKALKRLGSQTKKMQIIEGASHLFEEPGKLDEVAEAASQWFLTYLK
ncbi:MAG: dienelactone hydrolase family protein [Patescibacteria group bacterium]|nr:dienelactone hydrolase family protein [Patescibacteria group bacterium]